MKFVHAVLAIACIHVQSFAFGPGGHMAVGSIADELLVGTRAAKEARKILGSNLRTASVWADCAKGVNEKTFTYAGDGKYPECAIYEKAAASKRLMEDFVKRSAKTCTVAARAEACHRQHHYTDVAFQHDGYATGLKGTSDHDVVAAISAMIAVLEDRPAPAPFKTTDKKEALRLLAHYVGDIHQPLHVGAVYLDARGAVIDPDQGVFDPITETTGGNDLLLERPGGAWKPRNLHHEWDSVGGAVVTMPVPAQVVSEARQVAETTGPRKGWSAAWATESVIASKAAYQPLTYEPLDDKARLYLVQLPAGYGADRIKVQRARVILAGARLAQILKSIWP